MSKSKSVVIKPHVSGLDEHMEDVKVLSSLLNEASALYDKLREARFKVSYRVESPTTKRMPQDGHSPSPEETVTAEPHEGH